MNIHSQFRREVTIHSALDHPTILKLIGICLKPLSIVLEYCPHTTLYDILHNYDLCLPVTLRLRYLIDIIKAIQYLHNLNPPVVHLDVKSPNIMVFSLDFDSPAVVN